MGKRSGAVTIGEQPGGAQGLGAGQAAEDVRVGVLGQLAATWASRILISSTNLIGDEQSLQGGGQVGDRGGARLRFLSSVVCDSS